MIDQIQINKIFNKKIWQVIMRRETNIKIFVKKHNIDLETTRSKRILNSNAYQLINLIKTRWITSAELVKIFAN